MSFRTRLTLFFALIVVVPMTALGVVVARLLFDSQHAKVVAANHASASAALAGFQRAAFEATREARALAADPGLVAALRTPATADDRARARALAARRRLVRVRILGADGIPLADVGDRDAIAAGAARVRSAGPEKRVSLTIEVSILTAGAFAHELSVPGTRAVIRSGGRLLASTLPGPPAAARAADFPDRGTRTLGGTRYTLSSFDATDFDGAPATTVSILTDATAAAGAAVRDQRLAIALLAVFLALAFAGAVLVSQQLRGQLARFLAAAQRIGGGDFSATVPVEGRDGFAQLGHEFNKMSSELEERVEQLAEERARLRESIQRVGATFAANLDRAALLEIGTQTIVDAVDAACGRALIRASDESALIEAARVGELAGAEAAIAAAEALAREHGAAAAIAPAPALGDAAALAVPTALVPEAVEPRWGTARGLVTVARGGRAFTAAERELVASLARLSCGVAASADGDPSALVAAADAALYTAKRPGKNRTVRAEAASASAAPADPAAS